MSDMATSRPSGFVPGLAMRRQSCCRVTLHHPLESIACQNMIEGRDSRESRQNSWPGRAGTDIFRGCTTAGGPTWGCAGAGACHWHHARGTDLGRDLSECGPGAKNPVWSKNSICLNPIMVAG